MDISEGSAVTVPTGTVVLSVDAELGWGFHDLTNPPADRINGAREGWRTLLSLLERHGIPATWGVVGHLFLDECDARHPTHPAPDFWFENELHGWLSRDELRFGHELIKAIASSPIDHDIGAHTFSHVRFDREWVTEEIVRCELESSIEVASSFGIEQKSFIFPRNAVGYRSLLSEYGFRTYRGHRPEQLGPNGPLEKLFTTAFPSQLPLSQPTVDEFGLVNIPPSLYLFGFQGPVRRTLETVWTDPIVRQARGGIARAIENDGIFHMWLHPNNIVAERDVRRLESIFSFIERHEGDGLQVSTMADVANEIQNQAPPAKKSQ